MLNFFYNTYIKFLYLPFLAFLKLLEQNPNSLYWLFGAFVVFVIAKSKIKIKHASKVLDFLSGVTVIIIMIVAYTKFGPQVAEFLKTKKTTPTPSQQSQPKSTSPGKNIPGTQDTTETQGVTPGETTPTYQSQKQLYYAVSCSGCWTSGCPNNGYSYGGYTEYNYLFYYNLCKSCSCNNFKAQSFWR